MASLSLRRFAGVNCMTFNRYLATSPATNPSKSYKLLIVGGGTGGTATANRLTRILGAGNVAVIEPSDVHYYQPLFTLVGGGIKQLDQSARPTKSVLPKSCDWIQDYAVKFDPDNNTVTTGNGTQLKYDYLVVAMGLSLRYDKVPGLVEALKSDPSVCSNYSPQYVNKTFKAIQQFKDGNAIFTFPNTPIKCAGAPQKIMYLTEEHLRKAGKRDKANIMLNTSLGVIFGVKKYADALWKVVESRGMNVNLRQNLIEVRHETKEAIFELLDSKDKETVTYKYEMLHAVPPMSPPDVLLSSPLVDATGYVDVNKNTLQHNKYQNVFGIGDCTSIPTSKTAAAVASQTAYLQKSIKSVMAGKQPDSKYDGYTSCPLVTARGKCIMAEFDFDSQPLETFPFNQAKERWSMYLMKAEGFLRVYYWMLLPGIWNGPAFIRKLLRFGMSK
ncbi:sulfide:quinone oxidoreductase, mitochondrial-like [Tubulanus polymorphus]|uniref:sulfide:quinone oxidoreductase, mitochondrial-like n=1 Tax=Tubulanus polymorphus TaxID=672921 RepID=UPI003DA5E276